MVLQLLMACKNLVYEKSYFCLTNSRSLSISCSYSLARRIGRGVLEIFGLVWTASVRTGRCRGVLAGLLGSFRELEAERYERDDEDRTEELLRRGVRLGAISVKVSLISFNWLSRESMRSRLCVSESSLRRRMFSLRYFRMIILSSSAVKGFFLRGSG